MQSLAVIIFILDCYPQAIHCKDKELQPPLHTASLQHNFQADYLKEAAVIMEVIEHLVQTWPDSIQIPCCYSYKCEAIANDGEDQDNDLEHLEEFDDSDGGEYAESTSHVGDLYKSSQRSGLPVDLACQPGKRPSAQLICLLTSNQMLPLHFVCNYAAKFWGPQTIITMDYLLSLFPKDATLFYNGMLPIHCMCQAGATQSSLKWWWEKCPDISQLITADTGGTLLHCFLSPTQAVLNAVTRGRQGQWYFLTLLMLVDKHPTFYAL